ncbi:hypothetical protein BDK51DRAFT_36700 [Blyttiomyces helicus]|uniref:Uncharacterized protein n=1 Tax=Blyttiomyces helicus TaxID=388810 RepID=A0A4P9W886_9FUNG|nr:hypothetical protein BDK51DRAFT_36700 [Blyttiomyces helicus]|eukprot:RKO88544.1 hypothetical protein BDK51DRAFT_36700 [Blyttiomyces helicus]
MTDTADFSRSLSSSSRGIQDYAPSSIVSTVSSTWDDSEHDYDAQATVQVQAMLERLETFLYHGERGLSHTHPRLGASSSAILPTLMPLHFPELFLVRNRKRLAEWECSTRRRMQRVVFTFPPHSDLGYELISAAQVRSHSPYFFVPENPPRPLSQTSRIAVVSSTPTSFVGSTGGQELADPGIQGIGLSSDIVVRRAHRPADVEQPHDDSSGGRPFCYAQSIFDWSDTRTCEALKGIKDVKYRNAKSRWCADRSDSSAAFGHIFRYRPKHQDPDTSSPKLDDEDEEDRCPTPTLENPNPVPSIPYSIPRNINPPPDTSPSPAASSRQHPAYTVEPIAGGTGGMDALRKQIDTISLKDIKESPSFALLRCETSQLVPAPRNPRAPSAQATPAHAFVFLSWDAPGGGERNAERREVDGVEDEGISGAGVDRRRHDHVLNVYDVMMVVQVRL